MKLALQRLWFGNVFYRIPRTFRLIGYINFTRWTFIGPFGFAYQTYSYHRWDRAILGKERCCVIRICDK